MKLGKSILLAILLLCYGSSGYTATRTINMVSIVTDASQYETVIKKILRIGWYGLSAELKYIDPWAHVGSGRSKSDTRIEQLQSRENDKGMDAKTIGNGVIGVAFAILVFLLLWALRFEDKKFRQMNGLPSREESCNKYQNVQQAQSGAEQGDVDAQIVLGRIYYDGLNTPQDFKQAYVWFSVAAATGSITAKKLRDQTAVKLTANSLEIAQAQANKLFEGAKQVQNRSLQHYNDVAHLSDYPNVDRQLYSAPEREGFYNKLIHGDLSLPMTFWVYFFLCNGAISLVQFFLVTQGPAFFLFGSCIAIWWMFSTVLGTIRAALKYNGLKVWSILAVVAVLTNAISLLVYTYFIADFLSNMSYQ